MTNTAPYRSKITSDLPSNNHKEIKASKLRAVLEAGADAIDGIYDTLSLADRLGIYNATTGVAKISETGATSTLVATPSFPKGKYFDVVVVGTNSVTGESESWKIGDKIISAATKWDRIPFAIGDGTVTAAKLEPDLGNSIPGYVEIFNDLVPIAMNPSTGVMTLAYRQSDGSVLGIFDLSLTQIPTDSLSEEVQNGIVGAVDITNSDIFPIVASNGVKMLIYGSKDGRVYIPTLQLPWSSVSEANLDTDLTSRLPGKAFTRINDTNIYDVVDEDDELVRGVEIEIPIRTATNSGFAFQQFPNVKTKVLKGLNNTGVDLLFRQTCGMPIRGRYFRGDFDPTTSGIAGTKLIGTYGNSTTNSYPAFPAGSTGDCWVIDCGNTSATKTANSLTFKNGDMLVKTASGYGIQPGPGNGTHSNAPGEFWNISNAGWFGGVYYPANSRIYILGLLSNSGPKYLKYSVSKSGELFTMGECDGAFAPASQCDGDLYIFSADATTQGLTGKTGDFLIYRGGWGIAAGQTVAVPNGKSFFLPCQSANEWSVRRADKSSASVALSAFGQRTTIRRKVKDDLALFSDSMFSNGPGAGTKILSLTGRTGSVRSYGGGTSYDVLAMLKDFIQTGDVYAGSVFAFWHGQNNTSDLVQLKDAAYRMAALVGSKEARFAFWSILGARTVTWNGSRFVSSAQEDVYAATGFVLECEKFYENTFPKQYFSPRKALLEAAATRTGVPDILNPGKSEAQSAVYDPANGTYGVVPFSFFFDFTGKPFTAQNLTPLGYWSTSGLPSGGVDLNYYLRTSNGVIGEVIVKVAGVWTAYTWDSIHLSPEGQDAVAAKFKDYLTLHNI